VLPSICRDVLLGGACIMACLTVWGQDKTTAELPPVSTEVGVTFAAERAYVAPGSCNCFWLKGGGADMSVTFWKGLGIAAALTGDHASNAQPGVDVNKIAYLSGPRYTYTVWANATGAHAKHSFHIFGEGLFGGVHAFNSAFPSVSGLKASANSFALQAGGGINLPLSRGIGVRLLELHYVRTALPNNFSDVQNDFRVGAGVTYHLTWPTWRR